MASLYKDMTSLLVDAQCGECKIEHFVIGEGNIRAMLDGLPHGEYVRLMVNGRLMMSNTNMEQRTNAHFVVWAHGDVLIGGLGIGMIVLAIQDKPDVESITIVEKESDVISLMESQPNVKFNEKVHIICGDVFTWKPHKGHKFDCIYMDIWPYINEDVYHDEMVPLKRKYAHYLKPKSESPDRFNTCWAEWYAKTGSRL
jgi:hypothetical protein